MTSADATSLAVQEVAAIESMIARDGEAQNDRPALESDHRSEASLLLNSMPQKADTGQNVARPPVVQPPPPPAPEAQFAVDNHPKIITGIRGELIPGGGTMHIRLDPPELGALQVTVHMEDGVMSAMFQTSTDGAYHFDNQLEGTYTIRAERGRCTDIASANVNLTADRIQDLALHPKLDAFGFRCSTLASSYVSGTTRLALTGDDVGDRQTGRTVLQDARRAGDAVVACALGRWRGPVRR